MNSHSELVVYSPPADVLNPYKFKLPPFIARGFNITYNIAQGAVLGYGGYWLVRLVAWIGFLSEQEKALLRPFSFVVSGAVNAGIIETARLGHDFALHVLGERKVYEDLDPLDNSRSSRLRQHAWKFIGKMEKIDETIDEVMSRSLGIRTIKEIKKFKIPDKELAISEIFRRCVIEQCRESVRSIVEEKISSHIVQSLGYTLLSASAMFQLHSLVFFSGIITKFLNALRERDEEEDRESVIRRLKEKKVAFADEEKGTFHYTYAHPILDDITEKVS